MTVAESKYDSERRLLVTQLKGKVYSEDVLRWKASLARELDRIEANSIFKMISDLHDYEPGNIDVHKEMRAVIPLTLAAYSFRTVLFELNGTLNILIQKTRGISCVAVAHIHHNEFKMSGLEQSIGNANERFFTDLEKAETWINSVLPL